MLKILALYILSLSFFSFSLNQALDKQLFEVVESNKKNSFILVVFPRANQRFNIVENFLIGVSSLDIIFTKEFYINNYNHQMMFLEGLYKTNPNIPNSWNSYTRGAIEKLYNCFPKEIKSKKIKIYLFTAPSLDSVVSVKKKIRKELNSHHVVHTTDNQAETLQVLNLILDEKY